MTPGPRKWGPRGWYGLCYRHDVSCVQPITARLSLLLGLALVVLAAGGCDGHATAGAPDVAADGAEERVAGVTYTEDGEPAGLDRYIRWSKSLGQGAQPMGEVSFANLKALGYRTILSVDGSQPEVDRAAKHGLRYVHVPIGYDGITKDAATKIVKSARVTEFPVYVHCHHGKHRGPAAAMLLRISEDKVSHADAIKGLERSGTSPNYSGLWKAVREFVVPTDVELAAVTKLSSCVVPQGLQATMVDCNHRWENLKLAKAEGWKTPKDHPDVMPAHEARMLWELFREMGRTDKECRDKGAAFLSSLKASEVATIALEKALRAGELKTADKHYASVKALCVSCHKAHRN